MPSAESRGQRAHLPQLSGLALPLFRPSRRRIEPWKPSRRTGHRSEGGPVRRWWTGATLGLPACVPFGDLWCPLVLPCPACTAAQPVPALARLLQALAAWLGRAPRAPSSRTSEGARKCFSSFSSSSLMLLLQLAPRTRGPASSQQSCRPQTRRPILSPHDPDHFHVMSPFNPRPRFVRVSPCLPPLLL